VNSVESLSILFLLMILVFVIMYVCMYVCMYICMLMLLVFAFDDLYIKQTCHVMSHDSRMTQYKAYSDHCP